MVTHSAPAAVTHPSVNCWSDIHIQILAGCHINSAAAGDAYDLLLLIITLSVVVAATTGDSRLIC